MTRPRLPRLDRLALSLGALAFVVIASTVVAALVAPGWVLRGLLGALAASQASAVALAVLNVRRVEELAQLEESRAQLEALGRATRSSDRLPPPVPGGIGGPLLDVRLGPDGAAFAEALSKLGKALEGKPPPRRPDNRRSVRRSPRG